MCTVKANITQGPVESERIATLKDADGRSVEVVVGQSHVVNDRIKAHRICDDAHKVLVELPRESSSGEWRVWVDSGLVGA